jgi:hypothetical protein
MMQSPVIVDQIENTVEAVTVGHLDTEGSSKQKGKGRRSRKSSSMGKRPMDINIYNNDKPHNSVLAHTNLWINQHDLDSRHS